MSSSIVLAGDRVIGPESGFDAVADVEVRDGCVTAVSTTPLANGRRLDASGLVVNPGLVDLHSHGQAVPEHRLQALDGVTTTLELDAGTTPVATAYAHAAAEGRPLNYGYSTSWALARMIELAGVGGAHAGARTFTHARALAEVDPAVPVDDAEEIVRAAGETGAHMHYRHVNSTSARWSTGSSRWSGSAGRRVRWSPPRLIPAVRGPPRSARASCIRKPVPHRGGGPRPWSRWRRRTGGARRAAGRPVRR